jgi:hypothetical protein
MHRECECAGSWGCLPGVVRQGESFIFTLEYIAHPRQEHQLHDKEIHRYT